MNWFHSHLYDIRKYFKFTKEEVRVLAITIVVFTFIAAFDDGSEQFKFLNWMGNFLVMLAIVAVSVLVHEAGHRIAGIKAGFRVEHKMWWNGLAIGLIIALITRGNLIVLLPGGIFIHHLAVHRLGFFRYGPNTFAFSMIAMMGPLFNIFLATFVKSIQLWMPFLPISPIVIDKIFLFNIIYAAYTLLPIPPLDGSRMFFHSRLVYAFVFGTVASYAFMVYVFGVYSYIYALIFGGVLWLLFYLFFEQKARKYV